jgi:hypothetical protein
LARLRQCRESAAKVSISKTSVPSRSRRELAAVAPPTRKKRITGDAPNATPPAFRWWRYLDASSQRVYYYEEISGITTWQEPSQPWFDAVDVSSGVSWSEPVLLSAEEPDLVTPQDWLSTLQSNLNVLSRDVTSTDPAELR